MGLTYRKSFLVAAVALARCAPSAAAQGGPFEGCKVTMGPPTVRLTCGPDALDVTDAPPGGPEGGGYLAGVVAGLVESSPAPVEQTKVPLDIVGTRLTAVRIASASTRWLLTTLPRPEGRRILICRERISAASRCTAWFEAAAGWGWRSGPAPAVPREILEPTLAGKRFEVPAGCEVAQARTGFVVRCPDGGFMWAEIPSGAIWNPDQASRPMAMVFTESRPSRRCWLDRAPTRCHTKATPDGSGQLHVSEAVTVRGKVIGAICYGDAKGSALPPVCASAMSFEPPGP